LKIAEEEEGEKGERPVDGDQTTDDGGLRAERGASAFV